ncbi:MAG: VacB/RNase II family 3'-5' exoribonuclease [Proteobacteria bacterium]|nr:VacB/RNase II family 3'-5' exoribonuclease [Pseudomonadota bacterium]
MASLDRSRIEAALAGPRRPAFTLAALGRRLGLGRGSQRTLRRQVASLVAEGVLEKVGRRVRLARRDGLVEATVSSDRNFALDDAGERWRLETRAGARAGDRVLIDPNREGRGRRGDVLQVISGDRDEWVGIFQPGRGGGSLIPYRDDAQWRLRVSARDRGGTAAGEVVAAVPVERRKRSSEPWVRVVERLGQPGEAEADFRAVAWRRRLPVEFPEATLQEAEAAEPSRDAVERLDWRSRPFVTIDPASARDHDDAVWVEPREGDRLRLCVAIADVSHWVRAGSALDVEALRRGNSVYFPDRAVPMLPERLSADRCSLLPDCDRSALAVELEVDGRGRARLERIAPVVVRCAARLDYETAARVMEGEEIPGLGAEVTEGIRRLAVVAERLRRRRFRAGSLDFALPEAHVVLDEAGRPEAIGQAVRTVAHRAVEEAMLAANRAVARWLEAAGRAVPYRIHEPPSLENLADLGGLLHELGLRSHPEAADLAAPKALQRALARAEGHPAEAVLHQLALRSLRQARYAVDNRGHFALGFDAYLHFTSPIRRYADLLVHRAVRAQLADPHGAPSSAAECERIRRLCTRLSWRERVAQAAEREMLELKRCALLSGRVGEAFAGRVSGVARHGVYVTLDGVFADGLLPVGSLRGRWNLDERRLAWRAARGRARLGVGDALTVRLDAVDLTKGWITLSLIELGSEAAG